MTQGLIGGAVAAVVSVLVSLPLHSPNDALFNTLFVAIGALLVGFAAGVLWVLLTRGRNPRLRFLLLWALPFAAAIGLAFAMNTQLDRAVSFGVPIAVIIFGIVAASMMLEPYLRPLSSWRVALIAIAAAGALGGALITQGDQESGELSLPPRASAITTTAHDLS